MFPLYPSNEFGLAILVIGFAAAWFLAVVMVREGA